VAVKIAGATVPMVLGSTTDRTGCSSEHGDAFPQSVPLTIVSSSTPVKLTIEADQGATERSSPFPAAAEHMRRGPSSPRGRTRSSWTFDGRSSSRKAKWRISSDWEPAR